MASISLTLLLFFATSIYILEVSSNSVIEDLNNQHPPPDFNTTIANKCLNNPSNRYCNHTSADIPDIFKSIIVAEHLCNESKNLGCPDSFTVINLQNRPKIAPLYLSFNFFWKYCPVTILSIFLSNNSIEGAFPFNIFQCSQMEALDLSHNQLIGDAPIESLMSLPNLTFLNLSYNHFSEVKISDTQFFQHFNSSSFIHSGLLPDYHKFTLKAVFLLIGFPLFVILTVGFWWFICFRRPDYLPSFLCQRRKFTSAMLKAATNGFSGRNLVAKMGDPENVWKVIDERLKKTGITEDQAANGIGLALMCIDRSTEQQPSLAQIADAVTMLYDSVVPATPNRKRRPHKERGKHERLQSR